MDPTTLPSRAWFNTSSAFIIIAFVKIFQDWSEMASKVAAKRGDRAPELAKVAELIEKLHNEMYAHIQKEEQVLFPFISQMDEESIVAYPPAHACFRSVAHPIFMMEQEHESARPYCGRAHPPDKSL